MASVVFFDFELELFFVLLVSAVDWSVASVDFFDLDFDDPELLVLAELSVLVSSVFFDFFFFVVVVLESVWSFVD